MSARRRTIPNYRLYGESFEATPDFWVHCETLPVRTHLHNFEIAAHRHEGFFQIFLITAGGGEMSCAAGSLHFSAPCFLFIPPGAVHGFRYGRDADGVVVTSLADRLMSLAAADRQIADFAATPRVVAGDALQLQAATQAVEDIQRELATPAIGRAALLEALMTQAIVGLVRAGIGEMPDRGPEDRDGQRIDQLLALIGTSFKQHRPVGFYAARIGISPTHLNRLARAHTGLSVQELVAQRLLEAARRDLIFSPSPVQTIAYSLGYSDPAYFNRFFRRMTGSTPGAFRTAERKRLSV